VHRVWSWQTIVNHEKPGLPSPVRSRISHPRAVEPRTVLPPGTARLRHERTPGHPDMLGCPTTGSVSSETRKVGPDAASASGPTFRPESAWNTPGEVASAAAVRVARRARASRTGTGFSRMPLGMGSLSLLDLRALVEVIQPVEGADRVGVFGCPGCSGRRIGRTARRPGHLTSKRAGRQGARKCHRADDAHKCSSHAFLPFDSRMAAKATVIRAEGVRSKISAGSSKRLRRRERLRNSRQRARSASLRLPRAASALRQPRRRAKRLALARSRRRPRRS
jgi:hypothetical protein